MASSAPLSDLEKLTSGDWGRLVSKATNQAIQIIYDGDVYPQMRDIVDLTPTNWKEVRFQLFRRQPVSGLPSTVQVGGLSGTPYHLISAADDLVGFKKPLQLCVRGEYKPDAALQFREVGTVTPGMQATSTQFMESVESTGYNIYRSLVDGGLWLNVPRGERNAPVILHDSGNDNSRFTFQPLKYENFRVAVVIKSVVSKTHANMLHTGLNASCVLTDTRLRSLLFDNVQEPIGEPIMSAPEGSNTVRCLNNSGKRMEATPSIAFSSTTTDSFTIGHTRSTTHGCKGGIDFAFHNAAKTFGVTIKTEYNFSHTDANNQSSTLTKTEVKSEALSTKVTLEPETSADVRITWVKKQVDFRWTGTAKVILNDGTVVMEEETSGTWKSVRCTEFTTEVSDTTGKVVSKEPVQA